MSEAKTDMMLNGICMVCENKDTLCTHIGQVKEECPFIQKAISTKITNAMRIRSMTDAELAEFLYGIDHYVDDSECIVCFSETRLHDGKEDILDWLQSEAE